MKIKKINRGLIISILAAATMSISLTLFSTAAETQIHPNAGKTTATFLKLGLGARPIAMGESFAGIADDANAVYWNPAGLTQLYKNEATAMHTEWFSDIRYDFAAVALKFDKNSAGAFSIGYLYMSDLERRTYLENPEDEPTVPEGTFGAYDLFSAISYSFKYDSSWSFGVNLKTIISKIDIYGGYDIALDLGFLYKLSDRVSFGGSAQNIGPKMKFREAAYWLPVNLKLGMGIKIPEYNLLFAVDLNQPVDNYLKISAGAEYSPFEFLAVRGGYRYRWYGNEINDLAGLTLGVGFKYSDYALDYAFVPFGDLGITHRVSFSVKFGGTAEAVKETVKVEDKPVMEKYVMVDVQKDRVNFYNVPENSVIMIYNDKNDMIRALDRKTVWDFLDDNGKTAENGEYVYSIADTKITGKFGKTSENNK